MTNIVELDAYRRERFRALALPGNRPVFLLEADRFGKRKQPNFLQTINAKMVQFPITFTCALNDVLRFSRAGPLLEGLVVQLGCHQFREDLLLSAADLQLSTPVHILNADKEWIPVSRAWVGFAHEMPRYWCPSESKPNPR